MRDPAEEALISELEHLKNATQSLCRKLDSVEEEQRRLKLLKSSVEHDLKAKTASLEVVASLLRCVYWCDVVHRTTQAQVFVHQAIV